MSIRYAMNATSRPGSGLTKLEHIPIILVTEVGGDKKINPRRTPYARSLPMVKGSLQARA